MRITGGLARGIHLLCPKNFSIRPTTDALRESVFAILGPSVPGCRFIDLFAGVGGYGLEALSRGARSGLFVEKNPHHAAVLRENLRRVEKSAAISEGNFRISCADAFLCQFPAADLLFIDPPYDLLREGIAPFFALLEKFFAENVPGAIATIEMPVDLEFPLPEGIECCGSPGKRKGRQSPRALLLRRRRQ
ncbi:MAG: RsmD family RNA methyltransferase [Puniceicoccales bacterium]|jgi:16S rRNA (guanine966-N2)-methyltransferase|nr:RsmD family RNA methyltransferase [Puniceicoccales bacterium]